GGQLSTAAAIPIIHAGVISGSGSLTKSGAGTIALAGVNTYTGDTLVRQGTLRFDGNVLNGAASILGNSTSAVIVGDDVGSNSTALLAGTSAALTFARDITVVGNASQGTSTVTIGSATGSGGVAYTGTVTLNRSVVLSNAGASGSQISFGKITGTGGVTIGGGGLTVFTSTASDFTGTVTIGTAGVGTGILSIGSDALLGSSGNAIVLNGGTLQVTGSSPWSTARSITLGASGVFTTSVIDVENTDAVSGFTITSPITGGGTLRKVGPGILTFSGTNTYSSGTLVEAGTLRVTAANVLSPNSSLSVSNGATVKLNGFSQTVTGLTNPSGTTGGTIDLGSSAGTILTINQTTFSTPYPNFTGAITGTGDVVKTGLSTQQLGGTSSYLGTTTVRQGILELTNFVPSSGNGPLGNSAGGAIRLGDANFSDLDAVLFNADKSINGFGRPITVVAGSGTRTIGHQLNTSASDGSTVTFSGPITLEKDLQIFTKNDISHGARFQISGVVSGTGGLVKLGAGQATLAADNTYTGTTTVLNGQLIIGGQGLPDAAARSSSGFRVQADYRDFVGASFNPIPFLAGIVTPE
ncbi:MAG TPA: autotransporter-associated beta strand repeat-containing protein, partial [Gemmata sp.]|nr:autotransporter-associated beta strand repeat-containing protein [Gemmata sp.]